ncbi:EAL domain-containing protein [Trichlorobacter lovleyi]|uniref:EAL and HDOD domain-containing protein n=1 Tax=Trichlorobacter lovleyi TaxID=313985 RepID=UPI002240C034|nr:EAL domain-containing protein [Trichlorobacter lovleyi]QOX78221.1 EAL domain-containing protein [Trichlorobacter lovleyi]
MNSRSDHQTNREHDRSYFIGRQPILNRTQEIIGYELLFRAAGDHQAALYDDQAQASASVIASALSDFGLQDILGDKYGFLNITSAMLSSEVLELLPVEQSVLELLENVELDEAARLRCTNLKSLGFRIALDDHIYHPDHAAFYNMVDIVKVDTLTTDPAKLPEIAASLRSYPVQLLAERVETVEMFEQCRECGFELFQGYFFERPAIISHKRIDASGIGMMKLLQQLHEDADINAIEEIFREDPGLTFQLLKLVNSVMTGTRDKIKSLRHAIMLLGIIQLRRWMQLSLFAGKDESGLNSPLLEMAAVRGRLMELLVLQESAGQRNTELAESAFLTGILSLLDALYETTMEQIVEGLNLSEDLAVALLRHEGRLGQLLLLAKKLERSEFAAVQELLGSLSISLDQLLEAQLDAFSWRSGIAAQKPGE